MAIPIINDTITGDYRRPRDGDPDGNGWQVDPSKADGINWALESISAPMAWGCSTGSDSTAVAVIDDEFHKIADLTPTYAEHYLPDTNPSRHGTAVASILAARGDFGGASTGVMWRSDLRLYDITQPLYDYAELPRDTAAKLERDGLLGTVIRLRKAVLAGARVINVSAAISFPTEHNAQHIPDDAAGRVYIDERVRPALRWVMKLYDGQPTAPLFVFSAGNGAGPVNARDALLNGYPALEQDYPKRVLVVGATWADEAHLSFRHTSNYGPLVNIAAPGSRVMALDQHNNIAPFDFTSAATPLVSGVAGLLISFDPSLSVEQVHDFIIQGAINGGQWARPDNFPNDSAAYLNAYEALKLAAARPGAPLCGNRVWNDGNNAIFAQRGSLPPERIANRSPDDYAAFVNAYHGGRRIDLGFSYQYDWSPLTRTFTEVPYTSASPTESSGAWLSYTYVADHDNRIWADRRDTSDSFGQWTQVKLRSTTGSRAVVADLGSQRIPGTSPVPAWKCIMEYPVDTSGVAAPYVREGAFSGNYQCQGSAPVGTWDSSPETNPIGARNETPILAIPAPQGNAVYVPVNIRRITIAWSEPMVGACNAADTSEQMRNSDFTHIRRCAVKTVDLDSAVRAMVYRIDTLKKVWTPVALSSDGGTTLESREINSLEVSEDGKEMVLSTSQRASHSEWYGEAACHNESLDWISLVASSRPARPAGTPVWQVPLSRQGASCGGWVEAGGTISPSRGTTTPAVRSNARQRNPRP